MSIASMKREIEQLESALKSANNTIRNQSSLLSHHSLDAGRIETAEKRVATANENAERRISALKSDYLCISKRVEAAEALNKDLADAQGEIVAAAKLDIGRLSDAVKSANDVAASWQRQSKAMNQRRKALETANKQIFDKMVGQDRQVAANQIAGKGVVALQRIDIANLHVSLARQQSEAAEHASSYWKMRSAIAGWESRTGKDHRELLKGDFAQPFGTEGPGK